MKVVERHQFLTNIGSGLYSLFEGMKEKGGQPVGAHIVASNHLGHWSGQYKSYQ